MGMEFLSGGDLHHHMHSSGGKKTPLGEPRAKFYIAEIIVALAHLHSLKVLRMSATFCLQNQQYLRTLLILQNQQNQQNQRTLLILFCTHC
jgi:serine/threonine protein kinase